jgi:ribosomal protein L29
MPHSSRFFLLLLGASSLVGCFDQALVPEDEENERIEITNDEFLLDQRVTLKDEEIVVEVRRLRTSLMTMRSQSVSEKVEDTTQFGKTRRDIARLLGEQTRRAQA